MDELKTNRFRETFWIALQNWGGEFISFITFILMARWLAPSDFGLITYAGVFIALMQVFFDQGITGALIQQPKIDPEHLDSAFWINFILAGFFAGILMLFAPYFASFSHQPQLRSVLTWLSLTLIFNSMTGVPQALCSRNFNFRPLAFSSLTGSIGGGIIGLSMALKGAGVWSLVGQQLGNSIVSFFVLYRMNEWRPRFRLSIRHATDLKPYAFYVTGASFLDFFNRYSDNFLIGSFLGPIALGYYSFAYRILLTMTRIIVVPFNSIAFAFFSRLQDDSSELKKVFYEITTLVSFIAFPAFIGLAVVSPQLIPSLVGEKWKPSISLLQILLGIGLLHSVAFIHGALMRATGKSNWQMWFTLAGALTNVVAFFMVVRMGTTWIALAYVVSAYFWLPLDLEIVKRILHHRTSNYLLRLSKPLCISFLMATTILLFQSNARSHLTIPLLCLSSIGVGILTYGFLCTFFCPLEIMILKRFFIDFFSRRKNHSFKKPIRILVVTRQPVFPGGGGSEEYFFDVTRALSEQGAQIDCVWTSSLFIRYRGWIQIPANTQKVFRLHMPRYFSIGNSLLVNLPDFLRFLWLKLRRRSDRQPKNGDLWNKSLQEEEKEHILLKFNQLQPDIVLVNYFWMAEIFKSLPISHPKIVLTHDVWHQKIIDFKKNNIPHSFPDVKAEAEMELLSLADLIVAINSEDKTKLQNLIPHKKIITAPKAARLSPTTSNPQAGRCLFVGSGYVANVEGINWFLEKVWPRILSAHASATLHICGTVCEKIIAAPSQVTLRGWIKNLTTEYEAAEVVIAPLLTGSGLKIKIVEAMGHSKAIVTTSIGKQGLNFLSENEILENDDPTLFAQSVVSLFKNSEQRKTLEENIRNSVRQYLSPEQCYGPLWNEIIELTSKK